MDSRVSTEFRRHGIPHIFYMYFCLFRMLCSIAENSVIFDVRNCTYCTYCLCRLSICLSSVFLPVCFSVCVFLCLSASVCLPFSLLVSLSDFLSVCLCVCLFVCLKDFSFLTYFIFAKSNFLYFRRRWRNQLTKNNDTYCNYILNTLGKNCQRNRTS
jgi:hypothetical protein